MAAVEPELPEQADTPSSTAQSPMQIPAAVRTDERRLRVRTLLGTAVHPFFGGSGAAGAAAPDRRYCAGQELVAMIWLEPSGMPVMLTVAA